MTEPGGRTRRGGDLARATQPDLCHPGEVIKVRPVTGHRFHPQALQEARYIPIGMGKGRGALAIAAIAAGVHGGCADETDGSRWRSGNRIRARVQAAVGGAAQFVGWRDSELGLDCEFVQAIDGSTRCLPAPAAYAADRFLDPGCTEPVIASPPGCAPPDWEWDYTSTGTCGEGGFRVRAVGDRISAAEPLYHRNESQRCERLYLGDPSLDYYRLGGEAPVEQFVAATLEERDGGPIRVRELVGEDGSRLVVGAVDAQSGVDLDVDWDAEASTRRWMPDTGYPDAFSDAECSTPISCAYHSSCSDARPIACIRRSVETGDPCRPTDSVIAEAAGETAPVSLTGYGEGGAYCQRVTAEDASTMECWQVGPDLPPDHFPAAPTVLRGRGRVRAAEIGVADGAPVTSALRAFRDTERDEDCEPLRAADGVLRCLPYHSIPGIDVWADTACSQPLAYRHVPSSDPCYPTPPVPSTVASADDDASECSAGPLTDRTRHIHSVVAPMEPPAPGAAWVGSTYDCQPYDAAVHPGDLYAIEEIPAQAFVEIFDRLR